MTNTMVAQYVQSLEEMLAEVQGQMNDEMFRLFQVVVMDSADRLVNDLEDTGETLEERWALEEMLETANLSEELEATVRNYL